MSFNLRTAPVYAMVDGIQVLNLRTAPVYAAIKESPSVAVRTINAFVLEAQISEVNLRNILGYVLEAQTPAGLFSSLSGLETLRAAVKKECGVTVTDDLAIFGDPVTTTGYYDTQVPLTAPAKSYYRGSVQIHYNRFNLNEAFKGKDTSQVVGSARSIHGRLAAINAFYGLQLEPRDVVDRTLVPDVAGFTLKVAPTSYLYIPGSTILIGQVSNGSDLAVEIEVDQMDGFEVTKRLEDWIQVTAMKGFEPAT